MANILNTSAEPQEIPELAVQSVLFTSEDLRGKAEEVGGYSFEDETVDYNKLMDSYKTTGFQATNFSRCIDEINKMIKWRLSDEPILEDEADEYKDPKVRAETKCTIFLGCTSNIISSGCRDNIKFLVKNKQIDCLVSSCGGIEEDLIRCLAPTFIGEFSLDGVGLRKKGLNRIGNLIMPNQNYCDFEDWMLPILDAMLKEQKEDGFVWSPQKMIARFGKEINNEDSILYWAWKNDIPIFCPALTDGSIGDMIYFHSYKNPGLIVDIAQDVRTLNNMSVFAKKSGVILLGGGMIKHHILNANMMRNGADYAVYINTGQEFDGSDAGARPDEAKSWGKLKPNSTPVKLYTDVTLVLPLIIAQTFAKKRR